MGATTSEHFRTARQRGTAAVAGPRLSVGFQKPQRLIVRAKVRRSGCGEAYVRTAKPGPEEEAGERVFVSDGASMLFWRKRTYRLVWPGDSAAERA
jgi:hypothetical protein